MARSNSRIRGAGGVPPGMVDVLNPSRSAAPDVLAARDAELARVRMLRDASGAGMVSDKNIDHTTITVDFSAANTSGHTMQFTAIVTGPGDTYAWDFGDGGTSTAKNPLHTFASAGDKTVKLSVYRAGSLEGVYSEHMDTVSKTKTVTVP